MMQEFKARLDAAQTPEERHAVIEEMKATLLAMRPKAIDGTSAKENLAAAKAKVADNPALLARLESKEVLLTQAEQLKAKLQEVASAEGAQKEELLAQAHLLRGALRQGMNQEIDAAMAGRQSSVSAERAEELEKRKQEAEELRKALREATPGERVQALEAWCTKRMAEMEKPQ